MAKVELQKIRQTHPFEIKLWNIRDPPAGAEEAEVQKWRRAYQYEIVGGSCESPALLITP